MESNALAIYSAENFATIKEVATALSNSDLVPIHFQKKPANVLLALEFAHRNNIAPFAAMQSMFVISGKVGMSAAMAISLARKHNVWKSLAYKVTGAGQQMSVTAVAKLHDDSEATATVSMQMAIDAGWTRNPIYKSLPDLMLKYRAATFLIRTHFPEVLSGMQTVEEIKDVEASKGPGQSVIDVSPVVVAAPSQPVERKTKKAIEPAKAQPQDEEAPQSEKDYVKLICDKFEPKAPDVDVADAIKTIRKSRLRRGCCRPLHELMQKAIDGDLDALETWIGSSLIIEPQANPVEQVPF